MRSTVDKSLCYTCFNNFYESGSDCTLRNVYKNGIYKVKRQLYSKAHTQNMLEYTLFHKLNSGVSFAKHTQMYLTKVHLDGH